MRRSLLMALLLAFALAGPARSATFFSIDVNSDELVRLDSATGLLTVVGPVGYGFGGAALALHGGVVYAINTPLCVSGPVDLVAIDPASGAQLNSVRVKVGVSDLLASAADGLTSDGTTLLLSYRSSGACGASHVLADLSTGGAVTNAAAFANTRDMDGLAWSSAGTLVAVDGVVATPNYRTDLYQVARPSTYTLVGSHNNSGSDGYSGAVFTTGGELWVWAYNSHALRRLDPATGQVLATVPVATTRVLRGLANTPLPPTPVEATTWSRIKAAPGE